MKKAGFNVMVFTALAMLGMGLVLAGLHAVPGAYGEGIVHREVAPALNVTITPVASVTVTAVPAEGAVRAEVAGYGTDKDTYSRGEKASGYIMLKNTGDTVINDATVSVSIATTVPIVGSATVGSKDFKVSGLNIRPGETKKAEFSVDIPSEYHGVSTAGDYDLNGKVIVGGTQVGTFTKHVKVV